MSEQPGENNILAGDLGPPPPGNRPEVADTEVFSAPLTEKAGDTIGRYKLLEQVGEGGFGVVYVAEQREPVKRRVALKIIKLGMDTRQVVGRFEAERQALAMMDHPNIAKVLDAGATTTGRPYFVMELVRGIAITQYCDENNVPTSGRLDLFIKVCHAIQHAHQKGIIHRDIKPSNILVTLHDGTPVPKVIDFGIAKATQGELTDKTVYTQFQQFIGTPAYMSPEQAEMSGLDVDTRSDIYALGVLLYELLVGKTPFDGQELLKSGLDEMRRTIREKEPVRPSTRLGGMLDQELTTTAKRRGAEPAKLVTLLRGDLDWIVMKCLEKDRTRRYDTANGVAADIKRFLSNEPVIARPASMGYKVQKFVRRNKGMVFGAAIVVATLVIGVILSSWQAIRATRAERHAEEETKRAGIETTRARQSERVATEKTAIAEEQRQRADKERQRAEGLEIAARKRAYASDMNLAQHALSMNNLGRAVRILDLHRPAAGAPDPLALRPIDLRGWEWRYLWSQCQSVALFTLCQQSDSVASVAASHDGKWIAVGELDGRISIWDLQTRGEIDHPSGRGSRLPRVAFSPVEPVLAYTIRSNLQNSVRLWDGRTRKIVADLPLGGTCLGMAFSEDGKTLITSTTAPDNQFILWNVRDGNKLLVYVSPNDARAGKSVIFSPFAAAGDMSVAAHGMPDGKLQIMDLATGKERQFAKPGDDMVSAVAFSRDGKIMASAAGSVDPSISLWDVASGQELNRLPGHGSVIGSLLFLPDGKTLASASSDETVRLWRLNDVKNVPPAHILRGHRRPVLWLAAVPGGTKLASACRDGSVFLWETELGSPKSSPVTLPSRLKAWCFGRDGDSVLGVDAQGKLTEWRGADFRENQSLFQIGTNVAGICVSGDGRLLAVGTLNGSNQIWDLQQRSLLHSFTGTTESVRPLQFLAQGKKLTTIHPGDKSFHEWDLSNFQMTRSWGGPGSTGTNSTSDAAFSPDGKFFASSYNNGFATLWETARPQNVVTFHAFLGGVTSVAFSPDSKRLATGSTGKEAVKLWDVESQQEVLTLEGHGMLFFPSAFSSDGNVLGSMNMDGALHLWRAPSWAEIEATEKTQAARSRNP